MLRMLSLLSCLLVVLALTSEAPAAEAEAEAEQEAEAKRFQSQELITAQPFSYIFNPGEAPRIVWRDVDAVRRLGSDRTLQVRWFDAELNEAKVPDQPGRWGAYVEGVAPNGTPVRRAMTFFARPPGFLLYWPQDLTVPFEYQSGPIAEGVWREHQDEISRATAELTLRSLHDSEAGAVLIAGLSELQPIGRPPLEVESATVQNDAYHLALKLKVQGLADEVRPLQRPRKRADGPNPTLREGPPADAGVKLHAKEKIDAVCRAWAEESGEPFVTLVARRGVIITHEAFGKGGDGRPIDLEYRADVASVTKTSTALLFAQFLDQGLIGLDDLVSVVFPDYPDDPTRVPTFRQCLTHTSGLSGHSVFGGVRNPHLENVILNGIDVNRPGIRYEYTGTGFDLVAKAMEVVSGTCAARLYHEHLFEPLGMGDVPFDGASAGTKFTARELAAMAQLIANRGSYGKLEFFSPAVFEQMLPRPLDRFCPGIDEVEGIGLHWMAPVKVGALPGSTRAEDHVLSERTIGHGSLSGCMFLIDLEQDLVIVQVRRAQSPEDAEWSPKFLQAVMDAIETRDG